jgi:hypothetical protein
MLRSYSQILTRLVRIGRDKPIAFAGPVISDEEKKLCDTETWFLRFVGIIFQLRSLEGNYIYSYSD